MMYQYFSVGKSMLWSRSLLRTLLCIFVCVSQLLVLVNIAPLHSFAARHTTNTINGIIFDDYNQDGVQDNREPGLGGVVVTAYNSTGTVLNAQPSQFGATLGAYTLSLPVNAGPVRLQFSNFGSTSTVANLLGYQPSEHSRVAGSVQGGTTVAFVNGNLITNTVNLGVTRPSSFCQANPNVVTNCYVRGDQTNAANAAIVKYAYNASGTSPAPALIANTTQVGSTWGLAYRRSTDNLFTAAYTKLLAGYKPAGNPGDIYLVNAADSASPTVAASPFVTLNAGTNPHNTTNNYVPDTSAYDAVGKTAIGGLALSEDDSTLYAVNLFNRSLYSIPVGAPTAPPVAGTPVSVAIPTPANCTNAATNFRPFAVTVYNENVYIGAVCSAESTQSALDMHAYVLKYNPVTTTFSSAPIFDMLLNYQRHCADKSETNPTTCMTTGYAAAWKPWQPSSSVAYAAPNGGIIYPQPELSSIAFDNGNLILGVRDRYGDQTGHNVPGVPEARSAGDTLRACLNTPGDLSSGWTLETNGTCGSITTTGANNGKGPGGGEYYNTQNFSPYHDYVSIGGLLQIPGFAGVMSTVYDPGTTFFTAGSRTYNDITGATNNEYQVFNSATFPSTYGKANGLGSLVAFCQAAPIEIGNRVWLDTNGNGIQDAGEPNVVDATVHLYAVNGTTLVGTTTTDAQGNYFFNTSNVTNTDSTLGLKAYTGYVIKLDNPTDYASGGPLAGHQLTVAHQDTNGLIDSKATLSQVGQPIGTGNYPQIAVNAHTPGQNDHTLDVGFTSNPDLQIVQTASAPSYVVGTTATYTLQVTNVSDIGLVVSPNPITVTYTVPAGLSGVTASASSGWTFSPVGPVDSPTSITATYTGSYPVTTGEALPPITITGTINSSAGSALTTTATVGTPGDINMPNESSIVTVTVTVPTPTPTPTATSTPTPVPTATPTPTPVPIVPPNLAINLSNSIATTAQVGQNITYTLAVSNNASAGPVVSPNPITVTFTIPMGLDTITLNGTGWTFSRAPVSGPSPVSITATYNGEFPVASGALLPAITVNGTLTPNAVPSLTTTASVTTVGDSDLSDNSSTNIVLVSLVPTATPGPTPLPAPDVALTLTNQGQHDFQVGQPVTFLVTVANAESAGPITQDAGITVNIVLPVGLTNVSATGSNWSITSGSQTSPGTVDAAYHGAYPVDPGTTLPQIILVGTLTSAAQPSMTLSATVTTFNDSNLANNTAVDTVFVNPVPATPTAAPNVSITLNNTTGNSYHVGQPTTYTISVANASNAGPVTQPHGIVVTSVLPVGLTNITASGPNWLTVLTSTTSPSELTATYVGAYPIAPGIVLPPINLNGILAPAALPALTLTATVTASNGVTSTQSSSTATIPIVQPLDVAIGLSNMNGNTFHVGDQVTYQLNASILAGRVMSPNLITVTYVVPVGLSNVQAYGYNWNINLSNTASPLLLTANYTGAYPVVPGGLPVLLVTGELTQDAEGSLTTTAQVYTLGDSNPINNTAMDTIFVQQEQKPCQQNDQRNNHGQKQNDQRNNHGQKQNDQARNQNQCRNSNGNDQSQSSSNQDFAQYHSQ